VISSEAKSALGVRASADVINLAAVWGLGQERGRETLGIGPRSVVANAQMRRRSWRGVIDVVDGGDSTKKALPAKGDKEKRKASGAVQDGGGQASQPMSKRQAKRLRLEAQRKAITGSQPSTGPEADVASADKTKDKAEGENDI
jgi:ribonuclease P/MRP protein subunit RPP1